MATPHVSGLAALIWLFRPQLSMTQVPEELACISWGCQGHL